MADLSPRGPVACLGCDVVMPNAALDATLCPTCLDEFADFGFEPVSGPSAPRGPGPDDVNEGELS